MHLIGLLLCAEFGYRLDRALFLLTKSFCIQTLVSCGDCHVLREIWLPTVEKAHFVAGEYPSRDTALRIQGPAVGQKDRTSHDAYYCLER